MSPKILLNDKNIYVSWTILVGIIAITALLVKMSFQQDQFIKSQELLDKRISRIEADLYFNRIEQK